MVLSRKATIFDIQRNSFVDGPGIRTTVFFKGCNLRCGWCHNPEGISASPEMMFYKGRCAGCMRCQNACPAGAIDVNRTTDSVRCTLCGRCDLVCPKDARRICGKEYVVKEAFDEVARDKPYYETSGGGVTCSGGECMLQIDFLEAFLRMCKSAGIHTAVDTAGNVPWSSFERILSYADLFPYDIKCVTPELHRFGTGADNALILENYKRLVGAAKVCVRVPVIGGFNADKAEVCKIAAFLRQYPPKLVEPLPYHAMGEHKYESLGLSAGKFGVPESLYDLE